MAKVNALRGTQGIRQTALCHVCDSLVSATYVAQVDSVRVLLLAGFLEDVTHYMYFAIFVQ